MSATSAQSSPTVLVGPSYLPEIEAVEWIGASAKYLKKFKSPLDRADLHIHYDAHTMNSSIGGAAVTVELVELLASLNSDANCYFLAERERTSFFEGAFLAPVRIANYARYAWLLLQRLRPKLVVFHNHPHELFTYVLLKTALRLRIPTVLVHFGALPWRMAISRYAPDGTLRRMRVKDACTTEEREAITQYMRRLKGSHEHAIPFVDKKLIAANRRALSFADELRALAKGAVVKNLLRVAKKWTLYRTFNHFVRDEQPASYVAFLMHYQPEESTIPRGDIFAQQLNALLVLRSLLPPQIAILVKENRATFRAPLTLAMGVRSSEFYAAVASIPAAYLVPLERDTFDLIDGSLAVATITGTVGLEALCRGKRVVVFGDANYSDFTGVRVIGRGRVACGELASFVLGRHDPACTENDMLSEMNQSLGPATEDNQENFRSQQAATISAFGYVARNALRLIGECRAE